MRRSEITPELINLSKRAKELGFPQDVEVGMWVMIKFPRLDWRPQLFDTGWSVEEGYMYSYSADDDYGEWHLILSFSRCLEWLEANNKGEMIGLDLNNFIHGHWIMGIKTKTHRGKNIHECGAKAVVKRLEEN